MYFVGVQSSFPYRLDLERLYRFDSASRVMSQAKVEVVGEDITDPILRIRYIMG